MSHVEDIEANEDQAQKAVNASSTWVHAEVLEDNRGRAHSSAWSTDIWHRDCADLLEASQHLHRRSSHSNPILHIAWIHKRRDRTSGARGILTPRASAMQSAHHAKVTQRALIHKDSIIQNLGECHSNGPGRVSSRVEDGSVLCSDLGDPPRTRSGV